MSYYLGSRSFIPETCRTALPTAEIYRCCTKVIMSGVNGNVIMSGCGDDNSDDERRETARDNTKSVSRRADSGGGGDGDRSQRAAVLPDQGTGNQARSEGSGPWESGQGVLSARLRRRRLSG